MVMLMIVVVVAIISITTHAQQACRLTEPDILGPYYKAGAPRSAEQLCANSPAHDRLVLTGQVVDYDSKCTRGIPNVKLDLWQANSDGVYSTGKDASGWFCRGIFTADANGRFRIKTLMPGRYNDGGYRPAHIHFNITVEAYPRLITQLYFNQDYYLSPRDSCKSCGSGSESLKVSTVHRDDIKTFEGDWTIVLSKIPRIPFPPVSDRTRQRGSYLHIKEHTMH